MFYCPRKEDIDLLMNLHYEDFKNSTIISYNLENNRNKGIGLFLQELQDSGWKGGYLKKYGILYPFLLFLYFILGSLRLYICDVKKLKSL